MKYRLITLLLIVFAWCVSLSNGYIDTFEESVRFKSLPNGNIHVHFDFTISDRSLSNHTRLFPRALAEILDAHSVQELHFTLTQGYWNHDFWGVSSSSVPTGALVWAWFNAPDIKTANSKWRGLTSRLSGLTCASLNFLDEKTSIEPRFSFRPEGLIDRKRNNDQVFVRVGALPREHICTENLTPWTKLLPCGISKGLGSLLRSKQLFNTLFHSEGVHFVQKSSNKVELKLSMSLVFERPPSYKTTESLARKVLGSLAIFPCHPASKTTVEIWKDNNWVQFDHNQINSLPLTELPVWPDTMKIPLIFSPMKYIGGYGQEYGNMIVEMKNHLEDRALPVLYVEMLPWYIRPYLHTMKIELSKGNEEKVAVDHGNLFHYTPGRDRAVLHKLEMSLIIPPKSTATISLLVEKRHLKWDEYPPDANQGFYLPAARFEVNVTESKTLHYYSRILLVNLSTPDFSMPYNVICLTCTVVALAFGPIHNITTKYLQLNQIKPRPKGIKGYIKRILRMKEDEPVEVTTKVETTTAGESSESQEQQNESIAEAEVIIKSSPSKSIKSSPNKKVIKESLNETSDSSSSIASGLGSLRISPRNEQK